MGHDWEPTLKINLLHLSYPHDGKDVGYDTGRRRRRELDRDAVEEAQQRWGKSLIQVGTKYRSAAAFVDSNYAYDFRPVLFKPAEAAIRPFRNERAGAISYFQGGNEEYSEDWGFALDAWRIARFENEEVAAGRGQGWALGYAVYQGRGGLQRKTEFLASYVPDSTGMLKLNVMHCSFPFVPGQGVARAEAVQQEPAPVSRREIEDYQKLWADAIVDIGHNRSDVSRARRVAKELVDTLYGFSEGPVLFQPTEANADTRFRFTRLGAVSYFAGGDAEYPSDRGFARRPWARVYFKNHGVLTGSSQATAMGEAVFTDPAGAEVRLEYTMNYLRDVDGRLRLNVHHLSIPYDAKTNSTWDDLANNAYEAARWAQRFAPGASSMYAMLNPNVLLILALALSALGVLLYFARYWDLHAATMLPRVALPGRSPGGFFTASGVRNAVAPIKNSVSRQHQYQGLPPQYPLSQHYHGPRQPEYVQDNSNQSVPSGNSGAAGSAWPASPGYHEYVATGDQYAQRSQQRHYHNLAAGARGHHSADRNSY